MSPRTFARAFRAETGTTPAAYVEALRVEAARRLLETTDLTVAAVARRVGLRHAETLHRAFRRRVGTTPDRYRQHFAPPPEPRPRPPREDPPCRSPSASTPASPRSTPSAPTRCSRTSPAPRSCSAPSGRGASTDDNGLLHLRHRAHLRRRARARRPARARRLVTRRLARDGDPIVDWIASAHATTTCTTSVCTGALLLGAAGMLDGLAATTHWIAYDELAGYGAHPTEQRVVVEGKVATAAGVSAGIDLALTLVGRDRGPEVAQAIQLGIEYDPQPPFDAGAPSKAPADILALVEAVSAPRRPPPSSAGPDPHGRAGALHVETRERSEVEDLDQVGSSGGQRIGELGGGRRRRRRPRR